MMQRIIRLVDHLRLFGVGLVSDPTDIVFCLALALLPAGGTVFGFSMMYWSPISPVLFVLHVLLNVRFVPRVFSRYGAIMLYPAALIVVSVYGGRASGSMCTRRSKHLWRFFRAYRALFLWTLRFG